MNRPWRKLLLLSMLAALGGWWLAQRHAAGSELAVNAAAPDVLQLGRLRLEPCSIGRTDIGVATARAYCTGFPVPEDRAHPDGRTIRLKVAIVPAEAAESARDLVVFLDGGPGGAATADYPAIAAAFGPLRKRHALLLVDQRGTGGSNALECAPEPDVAKAAAPDESAALARLRACLAQLAPRAAPQFYATGDAVADLEDLRLALGGPQFDLVGVSYGTRVAQQYAKAHADAVRALVLDSAVPNDLALGGEHARNLEDALAALFRRCRSEAACADRYGDPYRTLRDLQARLRARPVSLRLRDPYTFRPREQHVTADSLAQLVRIYAYNPHTAALLPYLLHEAAGGDYAPLMGQSQLVVDDVAGSLDDGMALSVLCTEDVDRLRVNPADEGTVLGNSLPRWLLAACAIWPRGARAPDFGEPAARRSAGAGARRRTRSGDAGPLRPENRGIAPARAAAATRRAGPRSARRGLRAAPGVGIHPHARCA